MWPPVSASGQHSSRSSARCGSDLRQLTRSHLVVTSTAFSNLQSTQSFLPSLFYVCKPDVFSSLSELTFCLVLSNDERARCYSWQIPSSRAPRTPISEAQYSREAKHITIGLSAKMESILWQKGWLHVALRKNMTHFRHPIMELSRLWDDQGSLHL